MELDYDLSKIEESTDEIYRKLTRLPPEIKVKLQRRIINSPLIEKYPTEIKYPFIFRRGFTDLSDLVDIED